AADLFLFGGGPAGHAVVFPRGEALVGGELDLIEDVRAAELLEHVRVRRVAKLEGTGGAGGGGCGLGGHAGGAGERGSTGGERGGEEGAAGHRCGEGWRGSRRTAGHARYARR